MQNAYRLVDRTDEDVLDLCHHAVVAHVHARVAENTAVRAVTERLGASPAQVGLAWLLAHRDNVLLIPGTSSLAHLEENMRISDVVLSEDDVAELERAEREVS